jgi:hypothetical protein
MTTPRSKDSSYTEGRIELAIQAFKKGQFQSLQAAALTYDAPITTVRRRSHHSEHHQGVAYVIHQNITLVHAQGVKAAFN